MIRGAGGPKMRPLTGSQVARATAVLKTGFPAAELVAGQLFADGLGAIAQFHDPTRQYGQHGTICIRWDSGSPMFSGHYFDDEFAVDVDFIFRANRGY